MDHIILGIVIQIEGLFKTLDAYFIFRISENQSNCNHETRVYIG